MFKNVLCNGILILAGAVALVGSVFGQDHVLSGKVRNLERTTGAPISDVRVDIDQSSVIAKTDANGNYSIIIPEGTHSIRFSKDGYIGLNKTDLNVDANKVFDVSLVANMQESPSGNIECKLSDYQELNRTTTTYPNSLTWNGVTEGNLVPIRLVNAVPTDSLRFKEAIGNCNGNWATSPTSSVEFKQKRNIYLLSDDPQINVTKRGIEVRFSAGSNATYVGAYESNPAYIDKVLITLSTNLPRIIQKETQGRAWLKGQVSVSNRLSYMNTSSVEMTDIDHMLNIVFYNWWAAMARNEQTAAMNNMEVTPDFPIPLTPNKLTPADKALGLEKLVNMRFENVLGSDWYQAQLSKNPEFTQIVKDTILYRNAFNVLLQPQTTYYWRVKASNSKGESQWSTIWEFDTEDIPTALEDLDDYGFRIYPNPTPGYLTIVTEIPDPDKLKIELYQPDGKILASNIYALTGDFYYTLDLSGYPPGLYLLKMIIDKRIKTVRIIKK